MEYPDVGTPRNYSSEPKPSAEDWLLWFYPLVMPLIIIAVGIYFAFISG